MNTKNFTVDINTLLKEIDEVWGYANFGKRSRLQVVRHGLLKRAAGYSQGSTSRAILSDLGMLRSNGTLSKKGQYWLWELWHNADV